MNVATQDNHNIEEQAKEHAQMFVKEYVSRAVLLWERADQFSTWMLGGAAASAGLLVANLNAVKQNLGPVHCRLLLWTLALSIFAGLAEKFFAFSASVASALSDAAKVALDELGLTLESAKASVANLSVDETVKRYLLPLVATIVVEFRPAVPRPFWALLASAAKTSLGRSNNHNRNKAHRALVWQLLIASIQLLVLAIAVVITATAV